MYLYRHALYHDSYITRHTDKSMRNPTDNTASFAGEFKFDPGGFIVCQSRRSMFVVIAKNASTSLKRLVHSLDYLEHEALIDTEAIHEFFGYSFENHARIPLTTVHKIIFD